MAFPTRWPQDARGKVGACKHFWVAGCHLPGRRKPQRLQVICGWARGGGQCPQVPDLETVNISMSRKLLFLFAEQNTEMHSFWKGVYCWGEVTLQRQISYLLEVQVSPTFRMFVFPHFAFMEDLQGYLFSVMRRNPNRVLLSRIEC